MRTLTGRLDSGRAHERDGATVDEPTKTRPSDDYSDHMRWGARAIVIAHAGGRLLWQLQWSRTLDEAAPGRW